MSDGRPDETGEPADGTPTPDETRVDPEPTPDDGVEATIALNLPASPEIPDVVLQGEIGRGGMGIVYRGRQKFIDRDVAVKVLTSIGIEQDFRARFRREAKILARMSHANIVGCYQAGTTEDDQYFLVMELIEGPDLRAWIKENGPLDVRHSLHIIRALATALRYAGESGIIHRDIKSENVLLKPKQGSGVDADFPFTVKLADLGLARTAKVDESSSMALTIQGSVLGTPSCMSPEQFDNPDDVDFRSDIYGLGCVLFHMLTGKVAFPQRGLTKIFAKKMEPKPPDPRDVVAELPAAVAKLTMRMLNRDRDKRHASYDELLTEVETLLQSAKPKAPKKRGTLVPALVGVAVLAVAGWFAFGRGGDSPQDEPPSNPSVVQEDPESAAESVPQQPPATRAEEQPAATSTASGLALELPAGLSGSERGRVEIQASLSGVDLAQADFDWSFDAPQRDKFELTSSRAQATLVAGDLLADAQVEVTLRVVAGDETLTRSTTIALNGRDDPPAWTASPSSPITGAAGQAVPITFGAVDPEGEEVTLSVDRVPDGLDVRVEDAGGVTVVIPRAQSENAALVSFDVVGSTPSGGTPARMSVDVQAAAPGPAAPVIGALDIEWVGVKWDEGYEPGSMFTLSSQVNEQEEGLDYEWKLGPSPKVPLKFEKALQRHLEQESALNAREVSYRLDTDFGLAFDTGSFSIELTVTGAGGSTTRSVEINVHAPSDQLPLLDPLALTSKDGLSAGWRALPGSELFAEGDERDVLKLDRTGVSANVHALPRGAWKLTGSFEVSFRVADAAEGGLFIREQSGSTVFVSLGRIHLPDQVLESKKDRALGLGITRGQLPDSGEFPARQGRADLLLEPPRFGNADEEAWVDVRINYQASTRTLSIGLNAGAIATPSPETLKLDSRPLELGFFVDRASANFDKFELESL